MSTYRPCGVFATSYKEDSRLLRTRGQWVALVMGLAVLVVYPFVITNPAWIRFAVTTSITVVAVVGLHVVMGLSGQVSLGQSAFVGLGAYLTGWSIAQFGLGFVTSMVIAILGCALFGLLFGIPAVRVRGFYLALTTLAAQLIFAFLVVRIPGFGGPAGLTVPRPEVFGYEFVERRDMYFLILPIAVLAVVVALWVRVSQFGKALVAIRVDELAAEVNGVPVRAYKVLAFGLGSAFAGVAGTLTAFEAGLVHYEQFTLNQSVWFLAMLIVGGMGSLLGACVGAIALMLVRELLFVYGPQIGATLPGAISGPQVIAPLTNIALGVVLLVFIVYVPRGLAHWYRRSESYWRRWPFPY